MGYIKHHTIVVTGWQDEKVKEAHSKAKELFDKHFEEEPIHDGGSRLVSDIIDGMTNGQLSFFIAPDGSKEGWETSNNGNSARKEFLDWMNKSSDNYCDYVEVVFGGDDEHENIIRSKDMDLNTK